jgi:two-component system NtrC family response regulator
VIEGATVLAQSDVIEQGDLWANTALAGLSPDLSRPMPVKLSPANGTAGDLQSLEDVERLHIEKVLQHHAFNRIKSAQTLGITPKTLYLKIKKYGIKTG